MGFKLGFSHYRSFDLRRRNTAFFLKLKGNSATGGKIIYTGDCVMGKNDAIKVVPWWTC